MLKKLALAILVGLSINGLAATSGTSKFTSVDIASFVDTGLTNLTAGAASWSCAGPSSATLDLSSSSTITFTVVPSSATKVRVLSLRVAGGNSIRTLAFSGLTLTWRNAQITVPATSAVIDYTFVIYNGVADAYNNTGVSSASTGADPTASIGTSVVNGSAATFMRSDGAPAINLAIAPTWTGIHIFDRALGLQLKSGEASGASIIGRGSIGGGRSAAGTGIINVDIPANFFGISFGRRVNWNAIGKFTANANTKTLTVTLGGVSLLSVPATVLNGQGFVVGGEIVYVAGNTFVSFTTFTTTDGTGNVSGFVKNSSLTFSSSNSLVVTVTTATADAVLHNLWAEVSNFQ